MTQYRDIQDYFNPRSREGSDNLCLRSNVRYRYFNPRSREGSDVGIVKSILLRQIFQSALPRGERRWSHFRFIQYSKFQSALPRGERLPVAFDIEEVRDFNPRSREGSDNRKRSHIDGVGISIRAPARGATIACGNDNPISLFQSALPRGERPDPPEVLHPFSYFNPRSREGSDPECAGVDFEIQISIRAPARGATQHREIYGFCGRISIRAPARGATSIFAKKFSSLLAKIV